MRHGHAWQLRARPGLAFRARPAFHLGPPRQADGRFVYNSLKHPSVRSTQVHPQMLDQISPDCCRRTILGRAIAPATAAFQHVHDAADDPAIIHPLDPPASVGRRGSIRFHCLSLSQNRVLRTIPIPLPKTNQNRIGRAEKLMSSDPSRQGNQWCEQLSWAEGKERNACGCLGRWIAGLLYRSRAGRAEG